MIWLNRIKSLTEDYPQHFLPYENDYIERYDEYVRDLISKGTLESQRSKKWDEFNVRYGKNSVKGFYHEILGQVIWNDNHTYTKMRLSPADKETQMGGRDSLMVNPNWTNDYTTQLKTLYREIHNEQSFFRVYGNFLQYDLNEVDRIVFVDSTKEMLYHFDYENFRKRATTAKRYPSWDKNSHDAFCIEDKFYGLKHFDSFQLNR